MSYLEHEKSPFAPFVFGIHFFMLILYGIFEDLHAKTEKSDGKHETKGSRQKGTNFKIYWICC